MSAPDDESTRSKTSLTNRIRHEEIFDQFESAWQTGSRPRLADFLDETLIRGSERLSQELLRLDLEYRRRSGETPQASDYVELFGNSAALVDEVFANLAPTPPPRSENSATAADARSGSKPPGAVNTSSLEIGGSFGPYEILAKLGEGGMGAVYQARHQHLDKLVAIKVLPPQFTQVEESISRFKREMKAVGKIDHPNIVRAMDAGEIDGTHFLAMEFVDGTDLAQLIKAKGPFSVAKACKAVRQAASALAAAHSAGLVHRDVKPSNLLLSKSGQIKLLDLGLARLGEDAALNTAITVVGQAFGTPDYMAPEQWADSHAVDARVDLYALGCTLFFLLTGRAPYGDARYRNPLNKMSGHVSQPIPDLKAAREDVPDGVVAVYQKLMAKNPDDRMQSAAEVMESLAPFTSGKTRLEKTAPHAAVPQFDEPGSSSIAIADAVRNPQQTVRILRGRSFALISGLGAVLLVIGIGLAWAFLSNAKHPTVSSDVAIPSIAPEQTETAAGNDAIRRAEEVDAELSTIEEPRPAEAPFDAEAARQHQEAWASHLGVPVEFTNSIGMKFRLIPPGRYLRGSTEDQIAAALETVKTNDDLTPAIPTEWPQHTVILPKAFFLGMHETTQREYESVVGVNPAWFSPTGSGKAQVANADPSRHPVEDVNWLGVVTFCNLLGKREKLSALYDDGDQRWIRSAGDGYRLPTEAEWEFACRAGTTSNYWSGDTVDDLLRVGWFARNSEGRTHAVGERPANPFGLHDMHGNVWEWMEDGWDPDAYARFADHPALDPRGPDTGKERVIRGGDWGYVPAICRSASRKGNPPESLGPSLGFRVVLTIEAARQLLQQDWELDTAEIPDQPASGISSSAVLTSSDWKWTEPASLGPEINTDQSEAFPALLGPERRIFFLRDGKLMVASRQDRTADFLSSRAAVDPFQGTRPPNGVRARLNRQEIRGISMTEDGLLMALAIRSSLGRRAVAKTDESIWLCRREKVGEGFGHPVRLPDSINDRPVVRTPWLSPDGLVLIVSREGSDSIGAADLYQHTRSSRDEEFGPAVNLGAVVNTDRVDFSGTMSPDRLLLFRSTRAEDEADASAAETVMCVRSSADSPFEQTLPLDPILQAYHPTAIQCSRDSRRIYFHGSKDGEPRNSDLFMAERVPK